MNRKLILGAARSAPAAVVALPQAANAATCTYDGAGEAHGTSATAPARPASRSSRGNIAPVLRRRPAAHLLRPGRRARRPRATNTVAADRQQAVSGRARKRRRRSSTRRAASLIDQIPPRWTCSSSPAPTTASCSRRAPATTASRRHGRPRPGDRPRLQLRRLTSRMTTSNTLGRGRRRRRQRPHRRPRRALLQHRSGRRGRRTTCSSAAPRRTACSARSATTSCSPTATPGQIDIVQGGDGTDRGKVDFGFDQFTQIERFDL